MGSEQTEATSHRPSHPRLCTNSCGFFGNPSTMNLCSKCYREVRKREEQVASAKAAMEKSLNPKHQMEDVAALESFTSVASAPAKLGKRCESCKKKAGLTGFNCKCGLTFCGSHRYPEKHDCTFDFKELGRRTIAKANPLIKVDKLQRF